MMHLGNNKQMNQRQEQKQKGNDPKHRARQGAMEKRILNNKRVPEPPRMCVQAMWHWHAVKHTAHAQHASKLPCTALSFFLPRPNWLCLRISLKYNLACVQEFPSLPPFVFLMFLVFSPCPVFFFVLQWLLRLRPLAMRKPVCFMIQTLE